MQNILHPASERGHVNFGWLDSHHSFSFGHWYDPAKIHFGALRVLNDDIVRGGGGFGTHPHDNMEIISIPLVGSLAHKDSMGTDGVIKTGDVQIMSAGTGISHSEFNASKTDPTNFLQIWIIPKTKNIKPRYDQRAFAAADRINRWQIVVSPDPQDHGLWINQDATLALASLEKEKTLLYTPRFKGNGVYIFVLDGAVQVANQTLGKRDALGLWNADSVTVQALEKSDLLAIEVPMLT
jgi:quercetin 2,3-dioxygenase